MRMLLCIVFLFVVALYGLSKNPVHATPLGALKKKIAAPKPPISKPPPPYFPPRMQPVPEGAYEMGDHLSTGFFEEIPVHAVYIDAFIIDSFEVTNQEYCTYLNSAYWQGLIQVTGGVVYKWNDTEPYFDTTASIPEGQYSRITFTGFTFVVTPSKGNHPVGMVSWYGVAAYANWRSAQLGLTPCYDLSTWECDFGAGGYRLPTEAEWEKAARGGEHNPYYDYPWGDTLDGSKANYWNSSDPYGGTWPIEAETAPVGYYNGSQIPAGVDMANGYNLYDMAGNVWEWCNDWYLETYYQDCVNNGIYFNPEGPATSPLNFRVFRGAGWGNIWQALRCSQRNKTLPNYRHSRIGFRLVLD